MNGMRTRGGSGLPRPFSPFASLLSFTPGPGSHRESSCATLSLWRTAQSSACKSILNVACCPMPAVTHPGAADCPLAPERLRLKCSRPAGPRSRKSMAREHRKACRIWSTFPRTHEHAAWQLRAKGPPQLSLGRKPQESKCPRSSSPKGAAQPVATSGSTQVGRHSRSGAAGRDALMDHRCAGQPPRGGHRRSSAGHVHPLPLHCILYVVPTPFRTALSAKKGPALSCQIQPDRARSCQKSFSRSRPSLCRPCLLYPGTHLWHSGYALTAFAQMAKRRAKAAHVAQTRARGMFSIGWSRKSIWRNLLTSRLTNTT